jgi:putative oxidoreductase
MSPLQSSTVLAGRILLGLIFVLSGFGKIAGFEGTAGYIASKGLPLPQLLAALTIVVELGGGLALMAGLFTRQAAIGLAAFSLLTALVFHNFWAAPEAQHMAQQINFMKNLAIAGGMLVLAAFGPGRLGLDARRLAV